jgi:hypothetical protein|tara:strand:+ start:266 stop:421 length:156 start_codon:yes stop_codon:yes gene_type:complete
MNKFLKVISNVTDFIIGSEIEVVNEEETPMGFTAPKKRKYTKRKTTKRKTK